MNRNIRTGLLVLGIAGLVVPAAYSRTRPLLPASAGASIQVSSPIDGTTTPNLVFTGRLLDGTQPPAPPVPMHPPVAHASLFDGTQPPAPPVPMHPPVA